MNSHNNVAKVNEIKGNKIDRRNLFYFSGQNKKLNFYSRFSTMKSGGTVSDFFPSQQIELCPSNSKECPVHIVDTVKARRCIRCAIINNDRCQMYL